jgi:hypothetical protein
MRKASRKPRSTLPSLPSLIETLPAAQLASVEVMRSEWRDPSDVTPGATRTARTIKGWRSPLRACRRRHGDSFLGWKCPGHSRLNVGTDCCSAIWGASARAST